MYSLSPLLRRPDGALETGVENASVEGEIEDALVVSLPPAASHAFCRQVMIDLTKRFGRPVLVVTHNTAFLKARKLPAAEAAKLLKATRPAPPAKEPTVQASTEAADGTAQ